MASEANNLTGWADQDQVPGIKSELMELNMGPQHPATHGVLRLLLQTDGEIVYKVTPVLGYLHRCAEKIAEGVNYKQWVVYTDRFDYLAPMCCNHAYVTAMEKVSGLEVPERAEHIRVAVAELFHAPDPLRVVFGHNVTEALNLALHGLLRIARNGSPASTNRGFIDSVRRAAPPLWSRSSCETISPSRRRMRRPARNGSITCSAAVPPPRQAIPVSYTSTP